jgi:anti-sigma factor RsiW
VQHHLSETEIQNYQSKEITPDQLLELDDHLQSCELCRSRVHQKQDDLSFRWLRSELRTTAVENPGHLSYDQLESYIDRRLDSVDLENVQSHLNVCNECTTDVNELRSVQSELHNKVESRKVISFWRLPSFSVPLKLAGAAAAIAFFMWAATIPMRNEIRDLRKQLVEEQKHNAALLREKKELQDRYAAIKQPLPNSQALVVLNDGNSRIEIDSNGKLSGLSELPQSYQQKIAALLTTQKVEVPESMSALIGKKEVLMGNSTESNRFALLSPVGTVVLSDRPSFSWTAFNDAEGYRVYVLDENYNEVASSSLLKKTGWIIPTTLQRGSNYVWQVAAVKGGKEFLTPVPPAPEAKFQILNADKLKKLESLLKDSGNSYLVAGTLYAENGLLDDAEREFNALLKENPESVVAKKLLQSLQSFRHIAPKS